MSQPCQTRRLAPSFPQKLVALLYFDGRTGIRELLSDSLGFVLVYALFDRLRSAVNEVLGFLQTKAGHFASRLDNVDLVCTRGSQTPRKLRLFLDRSSRSRPAASTRGSHSHRSGCSGN